MIDFSNDCTRLRDVGGGSCFLNTYALVREGTDLMLPSGTSEAPFSREMCQRATSLQQQTIDVALLPSVGVDFLCKHDSALCKSCTELHVGECRCRQDDPVVCIRSTLHASAAENRRLFFTHPHRCIENSLYTYGVVYCGFHGLNWWTLLPS